MKHTWERGEVSLHIRLVATREEKRQLGIRKGRLAWRIILKWMFKVGWQGVEWFKIQTTDRLL
jgi:hypothetical protein